MYPFSQRRIIVIVISVRDFIFFSHGKKRGRWLMTKFKSRMIDRSLILYIGVYIPRTMPRMIGMNPTLPTKPIKIRVNTRRNITMRTLLRMIHGTNWPLLPYRRNERMISDINASDSNSKIDLTWLTPCTNKIDSQVTTDCIVILTEMRLADNHFCWHSWYYWFYIYHEIEHHSNHSLTMI